MPVTSSERADLCLSICNDSRPLLWNVLPVITKVGEILIYKLRNFTTGSFVNGIGHTLSHAYTRAQVIYY